MLWDIPLKTHRRMIQPLAGKHIFTTIRTQTIGLYQRLMRSLKISVQSMFFRCCDNKGTATGRNIHNILAETIDSDFFGSDTTIKEINKRAYSKNHGFEPMDESEVWKVSLIKDLVDMRREATWHSNLNLNNPGSINIDEKQSAIKALCTD